MCRCPKQWQMQSIKQTAKIMIVCGSNGELARYEIYLQKIRDVTDAIGVERKVRRNKTLLLS
ncbi:hypothetical protein B0H34DRAFT_700648 [Crassisporium funariophilum]|nr:hypothetical protein B0H34DRAFT_700648 [Crassisporium funariophilum]